jgi:hypothetical protein
VIVQERNDQKFMGLSLCRAAYACSLNTEAGPVPGVIYQSNRSLAFCSDKPVAYPTVDGHSEQAAYKVRLLLLSGRTILFHVL